MSKHNYSQYSNKSIKPTDDVDVTVDNTTLIPSDLVVDNVVNTPEVKMEVEPEIETFDETVDTVTLPKTVKGVVVNCAKLNVRAYPSLDAEVVCLLDVTSEVEIYTEKSTYDWVCVCTVSGIEGYCMKKFVDANL